LALLGDGEMSVFEKLPVLLREKFSINFTRTALLRSLMDYDTCCSSENFFREKGRVVWVGVRVNYDFGMPGLISSWRLGTV